VKGQHATPGRNRGTKSCYQGDFGYTEGNGFLFIVNLFQITEILRAVELRNVGVAENLNIVKSIVLLSARGGKKLSSSSEVLLFVRDDRNLHQ